MEECYVYDANFSSYVELLIGIRAKGRETERPYTHPSPSSPRREIKEVGKDRAKKGRIESARN